MAVQSEKERVFQIIEAIFPYQKSIPTYLHKKSTKVENKSWLN